MLPAKVGLPLWGYLFDVYGTGKVSPFSRASNIRNNNDHLRDKVHCTLAHSKLRAFVWWAPPSRKYYSSKRQCTCPRPPLWSNDPRSMLGVRCLRRKRIRQDQPILCICRCKIINCTPIHRTTILRNQKSFGAREIHCTDNAVGQQRRLHRRAIIITNREEK